MKESPRLRNRVPKLLREKYWIARFNAANETGLADVTFPAACPYTAEQALDETFWPGPEA